MITKKIRKKSKPEAKPRVRREICFGPVYNKPSDYAGKTMETYLGEPVTLIVTDGKMFLKIGENEFNPANDLVAAYYLNRNRVGVME